MGLLEILAIVTLLGILAVIAVPRFGNSSSEAKAAGCSVNRTNIEIQSQLWFRNKGADPAADLNDIMDDPKYFPDGPVTCPVDGSDYEYDTATQRVIGHAH
jgi:type II secretory pathway pseudopilin PulG